MSKRCWACGQDIEDLRDVEEREIEKMIAWRIEQANGLRNVPSLAELLEMREALKQKQSEKR